MWSKRASMLTSRDHARNRTGMFVHLLSHAEKRLAFSPFPRNKCAKLRASKPMYATALRGPHARETTSIEPSGTRYIGSQGEALWASMHYSCVIRNCVTARAKNSCAYWLPFNRARHGSRQREWPTRTSFVTSRLDPKETISLWQILSLRP